MATLFRAPLITRPNPRRETRRQPVAIQTNLFESTLGVLQTPLFFRSSNWPNPVRARRVLQTPSEQPNLFESTLGILQAPLFFRSSNWPNPVCGRRVQFPATEQVNLLETTLTTPAVTGWGPLLAFGNNRLVQAA
jgi:hypothetical protein